MREVGRTNAEDHAAIRADHGGARGQREVESGESHDVADDLRLDQVDRGGADERRHEQVDRGVEERLGRVHLLEHAVSKDRDPLPQRHGLDLVVGHVDRRHAETLVQLRELCSHRDAQLGVEVGKGLVHQERLGVPHDRPPHRDALALPSESAAGLRPRSSLRPSTDATSSTRLRHSDFGIFRSLSP